MCCRNIRTALANFTATKNEIFILTWITECLTSAYDVKSCRPQQTFYALPCALFRNKIYREGIKVTSPATQKFVGKIITVANDFARYTALYSQTLLTSTSVFLMQSSFCGTRMSMPSKCSVNRVLLLQTRSRYDDCNYF